MRLQQAVCRQRSGSTRLFQSFTNVHTASIRRQLIRSSLAGNSTDSRYPHLFRWSSTRTQAVAAAEASSIPTPIVLSQEGDSRKITESTISQQEIEQYVQQLDLVTAVTSVENETAAPSPPIDTQQYEDLVNQYTEILNRLVKEEADGSSHPLLQPNVMLPTLQVLARVLTSSSEPASSPLSSTLRHWESHWGILHSSSGSSSSILTDAVTRQLILVHSLSGNVGRVWALLGYRKQQRFAVKRSEILHAIRALRVAHPGTNEILGQVVPQSKTSNINALDNPTRWLDALLLNMKHRGYKLDVKLAEEMLKCYCTGWDGKATHYWFKVVQEEITSAHASDSEKKKYRMRLKYNNHAPPYYKIPSMVKGTQYQPLYYHQQKPTSGSTPLVDTSDPSTRFALQRQRDPDFSYPLAAAFAFADSLTHGACGHSPLSLNNACHTALVTVCVQRGAMWRAMQMLEKWDVHSSIPPLRAYNTVLAGLARVGDVSMAQDLYHRLLSQGHRPDAYTVRSIVDGLLNVQDIGGAVTVVQDFWYQHAVLPPIILTQVKLLEYALATDTLHEAIRFVYFIRSVQQMQNAKSLVQDLYSNQHEQERIERLLEQVKTHPQLQQDALEQLFDYFGHKAPEEGSKGLLW